MNFSEQCKIGMYARDLAKKVGHYNAAQWLRAKGISNRDALAMFGTRATLSRRSKC